VSNDFSKFTEGDLVVLHFPNSRDITDEVVSATENELKTLKYTVYSHDTVSVSKVIWENTTPVKDLSTSSEVRETSSTGGQKGSKLAKFSLIPEDSLWQLAEAYGINLEKYPKSDIGLENWRYGYEWSLSYDAAERHLRQSLAGEKYDPDNGVNHLISCAWHCLALVHYMGREDLQHFDDRQSTILKKYLENKEND